MPRLAALLFLAGVAAAALPKRRAPETAAIREPLPMDSITLPMALLWYAEPASRSVH